MKIIQINKFYHPQGGADKYFIELSKKLEQMGHEVRIFSMDHPDNLLSVDKEYFVSNISFEKQGIKHIIRAFFRVLYSREAKRKFKKLLNDFPADIIHLHNIYHQLSPSIISVAKKYKIPVVMHLHDYKLICPNYKLFTKGQICRRCQSGNYYHCTLNKCIKNSLGKSLLASLEMYLHHQVLHTYRRGIDLFIAPSQFMKKTCQEFNWPANKIKVLTNFFVTETNQITYSEKDYLLYFGRLSKEKGVATLIKSLVNTDINLIIAGDGPNREKLEQFTSLLGLENQVKFLGFKHGTVLDKIIAEARAVVIPSVWLENMPLSLLESLAKGKIVIASNIGGIPEIIKDRVNGFLFQAGNSKDLKEKIAALDNIKRDKIKLATQKTVAKLTIEEHYQKLMKIYQEVLINNRNKKTS